jgi:hypothetical protein
MVMANDLPVREVERVPVSRDCRNFVVAVTKRSYPKQRRTYVRCWRPEATTWPSQDYQARQFLPIGIL